jgi:hypothetical protein
MHFRSELFAPHGYHDDDDETRHTGPEIVKSEMVPHAPNQIALGKTSPEVYFPPVPIRARAVTK